MSKDEEGKHPAWWRWAAFVEGKREEIVQALCSIDTPTGRIPLCKYSLMFVDESLELEYEEYQREFMMRHLNLTQIVLVAIALQTIFAQLVGLMPLYYLSGTLTMASIFVGMVITLRRILSTEWALEKRNAQYVGCLTSALFTVGASAWSITAHRAHDSGDNVSQFDADIIYVLHMGFAVNITQIATAVMMGIPFPYFVVTACLNVVISVYFFGFLEVIPGGTAVDQQLFLSTPFIVGISLVLVRNLDKKTREEFLLKRALSLEKRELAAEKSVLFFANQELKTELTVAHQKIAAHVKPTEAETAAVLSLKNDPTVQAASIPFEDLELLDRIGAGAFGEVIRGQYRGVEVAVKRMLRNRIDKKNMTLLGKEIQLLNRLKHPNIVTFIGASWDSVSNVCIVLEFMERGSVKDVLQDDKLQLGWLNPKIRFAKSIAQAMCYLHGRKPPVIHRDLKAENVLVGTYFDAKVTDFGASRVFDDTAHDMTQIGTALFMAPEVYQGEEYTSAVDVYSFAMVLVELCNHEAPYEEFREVHAPQILMHKAAFEQLRPGVAVNSPPQLVKLMAECWVDDPEKRPSFLEVLRKLRVIEQYLVRQAAAISSDLPTTAANTMGVASEIVAGGGLVVVSSDPAHDDKSDDDDDGGGNSNFVTASGELRIVPQDLLRQMQYDSTRSMLSSLSMVEDYSIDYESESEGGTSR